MKCNLESHRSLFLQHDLPASLLLLKQRRLRSTELIRRTPRLTRPIGNRSWPAQRYVTEDHWRLSWEYVS
jgi:hypothetical protein